MQNFGRIKTAFNNILIESLVSKNKSNNDLFKKYLQTIKESEVLRTQFLVYNNIENRVESNEFKANLFIHENINLLNKFTKKQIIEANEKLLSLLDVSLDFDYPESELHESIGKLILTKRTPNNIDTILETTSSIVESIKNRTPREIVESLDLPNSLIATMLLDKYNDKYSELNESERSVLKTLIESSDDEKLDLYKSMTRECIDAIDSNLPNSDTETKDRLLKVKDKLLSDKVEINEDFANNISKLLELKNTLLEI